MRGKIIAYVALAAASLLGTEISVAGYEDVAVIVNTNSSASAQIGEYFRDARAIPNRNMIYVSVSTAEEIDSIEFQTLRSQVESYLTNNNLVNSINYIVTTKGVPLKVNRDNTFSTSSLSSSVESELMLLLGNHSYLIGQAGRVTSPYYYQNAAFSRATFGLYLVTRLDGYTVQHVLDLIDRSGPNTQVSTGTKFVMDQDPDWDVSLPSLNNYLTMAKSTLEAKGKTVEMDASSTYLTNKTEVLGYVSWGSNDHHATEYTDYGIPFNSWSPGSIGETYVSTSARSFSNPPVYGQSLIADWIQEGICGVKGYVYEPYSSSMAIAFILFDRYTSGYNLAESFFMSSRYLSWMDVVVGDPKTTIIESTEPLPVQLQYLNVIQSPTDDGVQLSWRTLTESNNYGFVVQWRDSSSTSFDTIAGSFVAGQGTTLVPQDYQLLHDNVSTGTYYYRLKQIDLDGTEHFTDAYRVTVEILSSTTERILPGEVMLYQNYPNPFNPSTTIRYAVHRKAHVRLTVYSEIGQQVARLVDEIQEAGDYDSNFDANGGQLASGVYFYRLEVNDNVHVQRMTLIK